MSPAINRLVVTLNPSWVDENSNESYQSSILFARTPTVIWETL